VADDRDELSEGRSFRGLLYDSFKSVYGWPLAVLAFVTSLALPAFLPEQEIKVRHLFLPVGISFILLVTILDIAVRAYRLLRRERERVDQIGIDLANATRVPLPTVIRALNSDEQSSARSQLLLRSHPYLGIDSYVSIFFSGPDEFEVLAGLGVVTNVQANGLIQIELLSWMDNKADLLIRILRNEQDSLSRIVVKPSASRQFLTLDAPEGYSPLFTQNT
jgi:hypothetical protein